MADFIRLKHLDGDTCTARTFNKQRRLAKVVQVYDGDTITVVTRLDSTEQFRQYKLRLVGLDTPELKPSQATPHRDLHAQAGAAVRDYLLAQMPIGSLVEIDFVKEEKFGRLLGTVWLIREIGAPECFFYCCSTDLLYYRTDNINQWLLNRGYAKPFTGKESKTEFSRAELETIVCGRRAGELV